VAAFFPHSYPQISGIDFTRMVSPSGLRLLAPTRDRKAGLD